MSIPEQRLPPATAELCPELSADLLCGAGEIATYMFGSAEHRRKVYHLATEAKVRLPVFRMGAVICARKSTLIDWIRRQESR